MGKYYWCPKPAVMCLWFQTRIQNRALVKRKRSKGNNPGYTIQETPLTVIGFIIHYPFLFTAKVYQQRTIWFGLQDWVLQSIIASHYFYLFLQVRKLAISVWFNWQLCLIFADDEEEYEEAGGGNRLLGFMFGNVDYSGDLDVDYLDEVICSFLPM